jgi:FixJ family two-component response regulator
MGFSVMCFSCAEDFLRSSDLRHTSCLITDMRMPGMSGFELYDRLVGCGESIPTIVMTAFPNDRDRKRALGTGVIRYLAKPLKDNELFECVRLAIDPGQVMPPPGRQ